MITSKTDICVEFTHGRKGQNKTEFKGVVSKIVLSALVMSVALGSLSVDAYAAEVQNNNTYTGVVYSENYVSVKEAVTALRNTIEAIEYLKSEGLVTAESLESLAICVNSLQKVANEGTTEIEILLNKAEELIKDVNSSKTTIVQVSIDMARDSLFGATIEVKNNQATVKSFPDVQSTDWYYQTVMDLVGMGAINGYPDGTFGPNKTISYAEYLTILVKTTKTGGSYTASPGDEWYTGTVKAAYESNILKNGEITDFTQPITRSDAAKFTERAVQQVLGEGSLDTTNIENLIKDYSLIKGTSNEYYILQQYAKGIVVGNNEGKFNPNSNLTRAEASTIILRTVKPEGRRDMSKVKLPEAVVVDNELIITEGPYAGRMRTNPSTEYDLQALQSAKFYKENGKLFVSIDLPTLPDGFKWNWGISCFDKNDEYIFATFTKNTEGNTGKQVIEIISQFDGKTVSDIAVTTLSVSVINNERQSMVSHKLSTNAKGQVLRQSSVSTSDASWEKFDTSNIFKW